MPKKDTDFNLSEKTNLYVSYVRYFLFSLIWSHQLQGVVFSGIIIIWISNQDNPCLIFGHVIRLSKNILDINPRYNCFDI